MRCYIVDCTDVPYDMLHAHIENVTRRLFAEDDDVATHFMWFYSDWPPPMPVINMPEHYIGRMEMI